MSWDNMTPEQEDKLVAAMKARIDYIILEERSVKDLITQVKSYLQNGYKVAGGVSSVAAIVDIMGGERVFVQTYMQALVRGV